MINAKADQKEKLINEIKNILSNLGNGDISPSAYDTAWVARIPDQKDPTKPMFPQCLQWVIDNQLPDGSWGAQGLEYYHDRVINTLSCVIALKFWGRNETQIKKGVEYLNNNFENLDKDPYITVGFELIFYGLFQTAKSLKLDLVKHNATVDRIFKLRLGKLKKIPFEVIYSKPTTILHSLEGFGDHLNFDRLLKFQAKNGSFLNSPAATAFVYLHTRNKKCLKYLNEILDQFTNYMPVNYPIDIFETLWVLNILSDSEFEKDVQGEISKLLKKINKSWSDEDGISWSEFVTIKDLDDTAVAFRLLRENGFNPSWKPFKNFFDGKEFFCLPGELHGSPSHIANFLKALNIIDEKNEFLNMAKKYCINFLLDNRIKDKFWLDKWHTSKYYVSCSAIIALKGAKVDEVEESIKWLIDSQNKDGTWGRSSEETDYVTNTLKKLNISPNINPPKTVSNYNLSLWIDKNLYNPYNITGILYKINKD